MTIEQSPRHEQRVDWLDYARLASAIAVVLFHYLYNGPHHGKVVGAPDLGIAGAVAAYGYLGVDFFFMVSGFVIMNSVRNRSAAAFAVARFIRLYPAFIVSLCLTTGVLLYAGHPGMTVTPAQFLANLTMMPSFLRFPAVDGAYWSLALEIVFYAMVFIVILLGLRERIEAIVWGWIAVQVVLLLAGRAFPLIGGFSSLFAAGCVLSFAARGKRRGSLRYVIPLGVTLLLSMYWAADRAASAAARGHDRSAVIAAGVTCLFFGAFLLFDWLAKPMRGARFAGALTYPLYLLHAYIGYVLLSALSPSLPYTLAVLLTILVVGVAAALVAEFVERRPGPLYRQLGERFLRMLRLGPVDGFRTERGTGRS